MNTYIVAVRGLLLTSLALVGLAQVARADEMKYSYAGPDFATILTLGTPPISNPFTTSDHVTGFFSTTGPLLNLSSANVIGSILDYSFTDGFNTITPADPTVNPLFVISTDGFGQITTWHVALAVGVAPSFIQIVTQNTGGGSTPMDQTASVFANGSEIFAAESGGIGTWTVTPVPEPTTLPLLGIGLVGIWIMSRTKKRGTGQNAMTAASSEIINGLRVQQP